MIENLIDKFCWKLVRTFPKRTRTIEADGDKYLLRFYLKHSSKRFPGLYLHHFYRGDSARDLHNHPWNISISLVLTGGYTEERVPDSEKWKPNYKTNKRQLKPGNLNIIRADDFHRVDLNKRGIWTLFTSGQKIQNWGFMLRESGKFINHKIYEKSFVNNSSLKTTKNLENEEKFTN